MTRHKNAQTFSGNAHSESGFPLFLNNKALLTWLNDYPHSGHGDLNIESTGIDKLLSGKRFGAIDCLFDPLQT